MTLDGIFTGMIYLLEVMLLFFIGKVVFGWLNRNKFNMHEELVKKDNLALALALCGYYLGFIIALGGVLFGESEGFIVDLLDLFFYGIISIVLLNLSILINDRIILRGFDNVKEIIEDQNPGTGIIEAGNHIAVGMIIYGAISGWGNIITAAVFWILGQAVLILAGIVYTKMLPFNVHDEIEKDNVAVGVAFAGMLIAIGNIIRVAAAGDFVSWQYNLTTFFGFAIFGLVLLPILRLLTDKLLLPGEKLTDELVNQETPNIGAGAIEGIFYVGASMLVSWVV